MCPCQLSNCSFTGRNFEHTEEACFWTLQLPCLLLKLVSCEIWTIAIFTTITVKVCLHNILAVCYFKTDACCFALVCHPWNLSVAWELSSAKPVFTSSAAVYVVWLHLVLPLMSICSSSGLLVPFLWHFCSPDLLSPKCFCKCCMRSSCSLLLFPCQHKSRIQISAYLAVFLR